MITQLEYNINKLTWKLCLNVNNNNINVSITHTEAEVILHNIKKFEVEHIQGEELVYYITS